MNKATKYVAGTIAALYVGWMVYVNTGERRMPTRTVAHTDTAAPAQIVEQLRLQGPPYSLKPPALHPPYSCARNPRRDWPCLSEY